MRQGQKRYWDWDLKLPGKVVMSPLNVSKSPSRLQGKPGLANPNPYWG
jgi:hypothetical protein